MKQGSTLFLRGVVILIGLIVFVVCTILMPYAIVAEFEGDFDFGLILLGLYLPAIPFFIALYQALKLLGYIDTNKAFSELSVKALRIIKYCALAISVLFAAGLPYIFYVANREDAPGLLALGFVIVGASFVITTFAAVLQKLLQSAVEIKSENDLTV